MLPGASRRRLRQHSLGTDGRNCGGAEDALPQTALTEPQFAPGVSSALPANLCPIHCGGAASQSRQRTTILHNKSGDCKRFWWQLISGLEHNRKPLHYSHTFMSLADFYFKNKSINIKQAPAKHPMC